MSSTNSESGGNEEPPENGCQIFMAWTTITTWHGINDLFSATKWLIRILWIFVMIFTIYMFMLQVTQLILDFVTGDKWGATSYVITPNQTNSNKEANGIDFPNITICNFNLVSEQKMLEMKIDPQLVAYIMEGMAPFSNEMKWVPDDETRKSFEPVMRKKYYDFVGDTYVDGREWLRRLSPNCEETIKMCSMGKGIRRQVFNCCSSATEIFFGDYGRCFVLQVPADISTSVVQNQAGTINGMTLHLNPDLENYAILNQLTNLDAGFLVALGYEPEYSIISPPIVLRPGSHSWLAVQAIEEKTSFFGDGRHILYDILTRGNPLGFFDSEVPCNPDAKLSVLSGPYLYETCIQDCMAQQIVKMCGCAPLNPTHPNFVICDPPTSQGCASDFWLNETEQTAAYHAEASRCIETCTQPCGRRYVTVRNSVTQWPAPNHVKTMQQQLAASEGSMPSEENVRNRVFVDIFFESTLIHVTEIKEQHTIVGLISNIGGTLGVWGGISIVTMFQLIVCLTKIVIVVIRKRIEKVQKLGKKDSVYPISSVSTVNLIET